MCGQMDRASIHAELELARGTFQALLARACPSDLRRPALGTRWTNQQLLFHLLFGYLLVLWLLPVIRFIGRVPDRYNLWLARALNAGARPFHVVNYLGCCGGAMVFHGPRMVATLDRTIAALHQRLDAETDEALARRMRFPVAWDPNFRDTMTLLDVYHYGTQHYASHLRQLTLRPAAGPGSASR